MDGEPGGEAAETGDAAAPGGPPLVVLDAAERGERATADVLGAFAAQRQAAAIAVGSRGRSVATEVLLGSVAMAVLHRAQRPVLVVPHERYA